MKHTLNIFIIFFLFSVISLIFFLNHTRIGRLSFKSFKKGVQDHYKSTKSAEQKSKIFKLENCNCERTLFNVRKYKNNSVHFKDTTCGWDAFQRGSHQNVAGFSFYGNSTSSIHKAKKYFAGIEENLEMVRSKYGESWSMRLYYDLASSDPLLGELCQLACNNSHLDLCHVHHLPGCGQLELRNAGNIFPMIWRFLPPVDPQVDVYLSRDLDSRITDREVTAVTEWLDSDMPLHSMRDHPHHGIPLLGGMWGARISQQDIRRKWVMSWQNMLGDPMSNSSRESKDHDQNLLTKWVWPWGQSQAMEHDSYNCNLFPNSIGFPTERKNEDYNFVASGDKSSKQKKLLIECPESCRRKGHNDWVYC